ncbi:MAG: hypothetical protein GY870_17855 [archaeon]|nr:hypothetical protein [archaeon]
MKKEILIGRLIPENQLIHFESNNTIESYYRQLFRQGACLGPRNLIFCEDISIIKEYNPKNLNKFGFSNIPDTKKRDSIEKNLALIQPDLSVQYKKYGKWDFKAYEYALVEKEYLFKTVKSTDLIPFVLLNVKLMYLPIRFYDKIDYTGEYLNAKSNKELFYPDFDDSIYSEKHYQFLSNLFQKNIKSGSAINGLFENINHNNKLLNKNQKKNFKVVYNGIGSIVKSAIVRGEVIIDSSLYYISPKSNKNDTDFKNKEAYYLLGMLNAPITTKLVKNMGSTGASGSLRNIHKNPLDSNIPSFNNSKIHIELGNLAKKIEEYVINYVSNYISKQIDLLLTTKSICIKCGKFYNKKNLDSHINKCSKNKDFRLIYSIFNSLNQKEKEFIQKEDISKYLIFNNKKSYINSAFMENPLLSSKIKIIISGILKPKTIQGALFRDLKFSKYLNELEKLVLKIKYNKS